MKVATHIPQDGSCTEIILSKRVFSMGMVSFVYTKCVILPPPSCGLYKSYSTPVYSTSDALNELC